MIGFRLAERLAAEAVSLPFDAWLADDQVSCGVRGAGRGALGSAALRSSALSWM